LNGGFKEADENSIHLAEDDPASIALLVGFLYRGTIPGTDKNLGPFVKFASPPPAQNAPATVTESPSGTIYPFHAIGSAGLHERELFQHISFQPQYQPFSPEELRVADYEADRKHPQGTGTSLPSATQNRILALFPTANIGPPTQGIGQTSTQTQLASGTSQTAATAQQPQLTLFSAPSHNIRSNISSQPLQPVPTLFGPQAVRTLFGAPIQDAESAGSHPSALPSGFNEHAAASSPPAAGWEHFGMSRTINYPSPAGIFLKGIPRSKPFGSSCLGTDAYQLAILKLCLLAERILWPALFSAAVEGYIRGELIANRSIPTVHVDLIYGNSSVSALRTYAIESMCSNSHQGTSTYLSLAKKYDEFLEDILSKLPESYHKKGLIWDDETIESFGMSMSENRVKGK
jgi:hypothetical protein